MLATSCFAFDIAHSCTVEGREAVGSVNNGGVKEKVLEQRGTILTALPGGCASFATTPFRTEVSRCLPVRWLATTAPPRRLPLIH